MRTKTCFTLYLSAAILVVAGCKNNPNTEDAELKRIGKERDSVIELSVKKDSSINAFVSSFAEIENNLLSIRQKEAVLALHSKKNVELSGSVKDEINENIKIINDLMDKNRQKVTTLNAKLKEANYTIGQLGGLVDILITNINFKNQDLILLNDVLRANSKMTMRLNTAMIDFGIQSAVKTDTINLKNTELNTAYYITGDKQDLRDRKIVTEKGGFFSPNQYQKINPDFDINDFTKIDIRKTTTIKIAGKSAKLITNHPSNSYKMEKEYNNTLINLTITDPQKFWSESKYLVVSTD
ncbi:MAG TPA: hypothetical protein VF411_03510 [Bacteroidia bacterium]